MSNNGNMASLASLSLGERFARPGIAMRPPLGHSPFKESDRDLLESKLEVKIGENQVKKMDFSADRLQAFVELESESGKFNIETPEGVAECFQLNNKYGNVYSEPGGFKVSVKLLTINAPQILTKSLAPSSNWRNPNPLCLWNALTSRRCGGHTW